MVDWSDDGEPTATPRSGTSRFRAASAASADAQLKAEDSSKKDATAAPEVASLEETAVVQEPASSSETPAEPKERRLYTSDAVHELSRRDVSGLGPHRNTKMYIYAETSDKS